MGGVNWIRQKASKRPRLEVAIEQHRGLACDEGWDRGKGHTEGFEGPGLLSSVLTSAPTLPPYPGPASVSFLLMRAGWLVLCQTPHSRL